MIYRYTYKQCAISFYVSMLLKHFFEGHLVDLHVNIIDKLSAVLIIFSKINHYNNKFQIIQAKALRVIV